MRIYRFLFCVFKDISFTVAPLDFWNSCKRLQNRKGAQWLSGRVLDSRPKGRGFEPHRRHCVVSLSKNIYPSLVLFQPRKTRPFITERLLTGRKESNQTNKQNRKSPIYKHGFISWVLKRTVSLSRHF